MKTVTTQVILNNERRDKIGRGLSNTFEKSLKIHQNKKENISYSAI